MLFPIGVHLERGERRGEWREVCDGDMRYNVDFNKSSSMEEENAMMWVDRVGENSMRE